MAEVATTPNDKPLKPLQSRSLKTQYLIVFNSVSALAWLVIFWRAALVARLVGYEAVHEEVADLWKWTQTLAALEVAHAVFGVVRAPILTTIMQVASRFLLVWGIVEPFPSLARSPAFSSMLLAHSVTEIVRYGYFALTLSNQPAGILGWLRYNTFFILYPLGIGSECWLVYKAIPLATQIADYWAYVLYAILAVYVPGSNILYKHMMAQRRKVMRGKQVEKKTQ